MNDIGTRRCHYPRPDVVDALLATCSRHDAVDTRPNSSLATASWSHSTSPTRRRNSTPLGLTPLPLPRLVMFPPRQTALTSTHDLPTSPAYDWSQTRSTVSTHDVMPAPTCPDLSPPRRGRHAADLHSTKSTHTRCPAVSISTCSRPQRGR
jgi:hypothetical protein